MERIVSFGAGGYVRVLCTSPVPHGNLVSANLLGEPRA